MIYIGGGVARSMILAQVNHAHYPGVAAYPHRRLLLLMDMDCRISHLLTNSAVLVKFNLSSLSVSSFKLQVPRAEA